MFLVPEEKMRFRLGLMLLSYLKKKCGFLQQLYAAFVFLVQGPTKEFWLGCVVPSLRSRPLVRGLAGSRVVSPPAQVFSPTVVVSVKVTTHLQPSPESIGILVPYRWCPEMAQHQQATVTRL
mmetsp:Transcript_13136/g.30608  ORF Transcript_13136/g.30608 Transcript_13136/m.30608 type:complete len:122 (-) Transcript_13136:154-519(-)